MKLTKKFNSRDYYQNFLPLSQEITNKAYEDLGDISPEDYDELMSLIDEGASANSVKRQNKVRESSLAGILSSTLNGEISKESAKVLASRNALGAELLEAYRQNKKISKFIDSSDTLDKAKEYEAELRRVVDALYDGSECFEQVVALALNYAQFSTIYSLDSELSKKKLKPKRLTPFEQKMCEATLAYCFEAMGVNLEMGQSAYVTAFGGRSVCTGIATFTAGVLDMMFKKYGIDGSAHLYMTNSHAFVLIKYDGSKYVVDPTQYFGRTSEIKKLDKDNAKHIKNAKILNLKKFDSDAHFVVVEHFMRELKMEGKFDKTLNFDDAVPLKLAKVLGHIESKLSKMSELIYPKGVFVGGRELAVHFYFELCLNSAHILYKTGCGTQDFKIFDGTREYYVDMSRAFSADNSLRPAEKFIVVKDNKSNDKKDNDKAK